jgi:hypothetical protein
MTVKTVSDIYAGGLDSTGAQIDTVYGKVAGVFAVYRTAERVMIQYADSQELGIEQRRAMAPLNPLRGEINGLVDGWRSSTQPKDHCRARLFDHRTADALSAALQGDQVHAEELLKAVKADILEERVSIGRVEYLRYAALAAIALFLAFALLAVVHAHNLNTLGLADFIERENLWLAAGVGSLGALFSIALGICARDIRTDLQRRDNIADAVLRIMIGAVSAVVLFSLLRSNFITLPAIDLTTAADHTAIVVAFLAGFSERLVAGYLTRAADSAAGAAIPGAGMTSAAAQAAAQTEVEATERNPRGKLEVAAATARASAAGPEMQSTEHPDDDDEDGCVCEVPVVPEEMTDDVELPSPSTVRCKLRDGVFGYPGPVVDLGAHDVTTRSRRWSPAQIRAAIAGDTVPLFTPAEPMRRDRDRTASPADARSVPGGIAPSSNAFAQMVLNNAKGSR